ncbi:MAG: ATP-dependent DNA helicase Rep, partial [Legionella sp. 21-45-4]
MLNRQQMAAIRYLDGPLLVLAGAGSGKTRVITEKIAYLIQQCDYLPQSIYAVTFTNKAAQEMKARISSLLGSSTRRGLRIATFHTLGLTLLKRHAALCGLKPGFSIFDAEDALSVIRSLLPAGVPVEKDNLMRTQTLISMWKNAGMSPMDAAKLTPTDSVFEQAVTLYP